MIYCGEAVEVMREYLKDASIDLVVTSPPYDNLRNYNSFNFNFEDIAQQLWRVIKPGGVVVWIVADATVKGSETGTSFRQALYFKGLGFRLHDTMIYEKSGMTYPDTVRYYSHFEYMFVFSKGKPKTINLIADKKNAYAGHSCWGKNTRRRQDGSLIIAETKPVIKEYGIRTNIWRYSTGRGRSSSDACAFEHPAIFPEKLAEDHIISWSKPGDVVLDPMAGSGTTLKMAKKLSRDWIGIEVSEKYCDIIERRLGDGVS